ncbi:hypothetical protein BX600DRAFT_518439 [Xylariales sp. PMI_506]|nr:hypothetical protein BX600DRAFT_518439 [Xylariales sp. PMI_506]
MSVAADLELLYRSWISDIQEHCWDKVSARIHPRYEQGTESSQPLSPTEFVETCKQAVAAAGGDHSLTVDSIMVDSSTQCVAARVFCECALAAPLLGLKPTGSKIVVPVNQFVWFSGDKICKVLAVPDSDDARDQLAADAETPRGSPDRMSEHMAPPRKTGGVYLDKDALEDFYRTYIDCINTDLSVSGLARFCNETVVHNTKPLPLARYCALIDESSSAVRGMRADIPVLVADAARQRVAARLEWTGTPVQRLAGAEPTGRAVRIIEHVNYQLEEGKIARVWAIVYWDGFRAQMASPPAI